MKQLCIQKTQFHFEMTRTMLRTASNIFVALCLIAPQYGVAEFRSPFAATPCFDIHYEALDYIWYRESRFGTDPNWKITGPAGEEGQYRLTPIWERDAFRLTKIKSDPFNNELTRYQIYIWFRHYKPNAKSIHELYRIYQYGPDGR